MSIKQVRQHIAKLVNSVQRGRAVAITRRGKAVAQIAPIRPAKRPRLPDLSRFRATLGKPANKSRATIAHLRRQERC